MRFLRHVSAIVLISALVSTANAAPKTKVEAPIALSPEAQARSLYEQGETKFAVGDFLTAAQLFEQSYSMSHRPKLLWNIAQAYRRQAEVDGDVAHLRRAVAVLNNLQPESPDERRDLAALQGKLKEAIAERERVEDTTTPKDPTPSPVLVPPTKDPIVTPPPPTPSEVTPPVATTNVLVVTPPPKRDRRALYIGLGVGAGVVVLGLAIGLGVGLNAHSTNAWNDALHRCVAPCQAVDLR